MPDEDPTNEPSAQRPATAGSLGSPSSMTGTTVRGIRVVAIGYAATIALSFVVFLVLARLISPADFGRYAAGTVIVGVGGLFAESGMLAAVVSRRDRLEEAASTAFFSLLISGLLLTLGALALAPLAGLFFHRSAVAAIAAVMSGWLFLRALTIVPDALLQKRFSFRRRVVVDPVGVVAFAGASIPLASIGAGAWALVGGSYASMIVEAALAWAFARFIPRRRLASFALWREMASFARPVIASEVMNRVSGQFDALMLGRFAGAAALGQYRNGLRLANQPGAAFVAVAAYVLLPAFARIAHTPQRIGAAARQVYWVAMTLVVPISFGLVPLGVPVAVILLGSRWRSAGHAIAGLCGLLLSTAISSISSELLKSVGRPRELVGIAAVRFCSIAVTVTLGAIVGGLLGVAVAMSVSGIVSAAYTIVRMCSLLDISARQVTSWFAGPSVASALMIPAMLAYAGALHLLSRGTAVRVLLLIGEVAVGALIYAAVLAAIDAPRRRGASRYLTGRFAGRAMAQ